MNSLGYKQLLDRFTSWEEYYKEANIFYNTLHVKEEKAWKKAKKYNTKKSFETYLRDFPQGLYTDLAMNIVGTKKEEKAWKKARKIDTEIAYNDFIDKYPNSQYIKIAKQRDIDNWKLALKYHSRESYEIYLNKYPNGNYFNEAKVELEKVKNNVFVDNKMALMWQDNDDELELPWSEAIDYSNNFVLAGYNDWRLPTIEELQELYKYKNKLLSYENMYWSCTEGTLTGWFSSVPIEAKCIHFHFHGLVEEKDKRYILNIRYVRDI